MPRARGPRPGDVGCLRARALRPFGRARGRARDPRPCAKNL